MAEINKNFIVILSVHVERLLKTEPKFRKLRIGWLESEKKLNEAFSETPSLKVFWVFVRVFYL